MARAILNPIRVMRNQKADIELLHTHRVITLVSVGQIAHVIRDTNRDEALQHCWHQRPLRQSALWLFRSPFGFKSQAGMASATTLVCVVVMRAPASVFYTLLLDNVVVDLVSRHLFFLPLCG